MQPKDIYGTRAVWEVSDVIPQTDYCLRLYFADGSCRVYDARPLLDKALYAPLQKLSFFMKAKAEGGTVVWNDDIDIAPEHLYECSRPV